MAGALAAEGVLFSGAESEAFPREQIVAATLRMSRLGLVDLYRQARLVEGVNLLVVVDQFEELFRYPGLGVPGGQRKIGAPEDAVAFVNLLLATRDAACPIYVTLTMRSDFLGDCAQFPHLPEAINEGLYLVPRMTREERRSAISGPVGLGGAEISPVLLTRLVNDVGDDPDQLSVLQHALNRTWARWEAGGGAGPLELTHYNQIGTMARALDEHANNAYETLPLHLQKTCERLFKALTDMVSDPRGIRRPATFDSLCRVIGPSSQAVADVIHHFHDPIRSFLTLSTGRDLRPDTVVDISHESLMRVWEKLKQWAVEEAESGQTYRRLAQTAALKAADRVGLLLDPELQMMLDWREREQPSAPWAQRYDPTFDQAMDYLDRSKHQRDARLAEAESKRTRDLRRARSLNVALGWVFAIGAVAGIVVVAPLVGDALSLQRARKDLASQLGWVRIDPPTGGSVQLGCVEGDTDCGDNERAHPFAPNRPFEIMEKEVTNKQFDRFVETVNSNRVARWNHPVDVQTLMLRRGGLSAPQFADHPAVAATWFEADAFCAFVRGSLPTEDQWEYAARGGKSGLIYPWGSADPRGLANVRVEGSDPQRLPVGSFPAQSKLYDMSGNVAEWTSGFWADRDKPEDHKSGGKRSVRGGSFRHFSNDARTSYRAWALEPWQYDMMVGFRCLR
jgi:formylglycine-generating enzyme required for sulfatase activity